MASANFLRQGSESCRPRHFRVIGRDLTTLDEPCTCREREIALAAYARWIEKSRKRLTVTRRDWRISLAERCAAQVAELEAERAVWVAAARYMVDRVDRNAFSGRRFNVFAVATNRGPQP